MSLEWESDVQAAQLLVQVPKKSLSSQEFVPDLSPRPFIAKAVLYYITATSTGYKWLNGI